MGGKAAKCSRKGCGAAVQAAGNGGIPQQRTFCTTGFSRGSGQVVARPARADPRASTLVGMSEAWSPSPSWQSGPHALCRRAWRKLPSRRRGHGRGRSRPRLTEKRGSRQVTANSRGRMAGPPAANGPRGDWFHEPGGSRADLGKRPEAGRPSVAVSTGIAGPQPLRANRMTNLVAMADRSTASTPNQGFRDAVL